MNYALIFHVERAASCLVSCNQFSLLDKINLDRLPRARWGVIGKRDITELFRGKKLF